jgi:hypothetical protein
VAGETVSAITATFCDPKVPAVMRNFWRRSRPYYRRHLSTGKAIERPKERRKERVINTLKEQLLWVRYFSTVEALHKGLADFADLHYVS